MTRSWISSSVNQQKVYFSLCVIKYFLDIISPQNDMTAKLKALFSDYPSIDNAAIPTRLAARAVVAVIPNPSGAGGRAFRGSASFRSQCRQPHPAISLPLANTS
ncbi:MAG: hypothetical protein J6W30_03420 [Bacteroidales bacterium]|nr:hypothetical protein [Bacteroidales bacterium]